MNNCPKCRVTLIGPPIPKRDQEAFGNKTHFRREIGIYDRDQDRTVAYMCPDCGHRWALGFL